MTLQTTWSDHHPVIGSGDVPRGAKGAAHNWARQCLT